jgi:hypothetical protein
MEKVFRPVLASLSTASTLLEKDAVDLSLGIGYVLLHSPSLWIEPLLGGLPSHPVNGYTVWWAPTIYSNPED